ncbi:MAG TPA: hypothetical protein PLW65_03210 [Pseudomonadota bacterium]|nr:hypothetical protein [Pseudomonadota bacterium]HRI49165.1 hypothetical protein [Pseudomonadota bacterium]
MTNRSIAALLGSLLLGACGEAGGTLNVTIYGEEFIEKGIPASVFSDGWSVTFSKFLVSVGEVSAARGEAAPDLEDGSYRIFNLVAGSAEQGHQVVSKTVPGGSYNRVAYRMAPPQAGVTAGNAGAADRDVLTRGGYGLYVAGSATKGGSTKTFAWGFPGRTFYKKCESTALVSGGSATSQLTIHGDHLFYDDLFSKEPNVSFELIATADRDDNGEVTQAELTALDIRTQARYQVGSTGITNLWAFITYQTSTVGHIDGEGHCDEVDRQ